LRVEESVGTVVGSHSSNRGELRHLYFERSIEWMFQNGTSTRVVTRRKPSSLFLGMIGFLFLFSQYRRNWTCFILKRFYHRARMKRRRWSHWSSRSSASASSDLKRLRMCRS